MGLWVGTILVGLLGLGGGLFARGRRGRPIDDHPVCRRCGFDLTGLPIGQGACPECGAGLTVSDAVQVGNRQRRPGLTYAGAAVAAFAALPLLTQLVLAAGHVDPIRIQPLWWVLRKATGHVGGDLKATGEILRRVRIGDLSPDQDRRLALTALRLQADLSRPWEPMWGDMVESLHAAGRLSAPDWQTYQTHSQPATFEVRPRVADGDPIPFHLRGELRGATLPRWSTMRRRPTIWMSVPGLKLVDPTMNWGGLFGSAFDVNGFATVAAQSWEAVRPSPHLLAVRFVGLDAGNAPVPSAFPPLAVQGTWTPLHRGVPSVQLYRDEAMAARVLRTLSVDVTVASGVMVDVHADRPPVDLAFDVVLRSGGREWQSPGYWIVARRDSQLPSGGGLGDFAGASTVLGRQVDVILRPSVRAAARTVDLDRLLDHEFVFRDVPTGRGR